MSPAQLPKNFSKRILKEANNLIQFCIVMNNNTIYGLMFGLIFSPVFIFFELKFFAFIIKLMKFDQKFNRPDKILALITIELLAFINIIRSVQSFSIYLFLITMVLLAKVYGLWRLKKWVIYVYILFIFISLINEGFSGFMGIKDTKLFITSFVVQIFIALLYYFHVYYPNKYKFI